MKTLLEALAERPLLGDGAMGTRLQQAGLEPGGCGEAWNLEHPERVEKIQRSYVEAGSDLLPEEMGTGLEALLDAGAGIVGGCCGSAPPHIAFLRAKMDRISRQEAG